MHIVIDARNRRSSTGRYTDRLLEHLQSIDQTNQYTVLVTPGDPWQGTGRNFTPLPSPYKQFSFNPLEQLGFAWQLYRLRPNLVHFTMTQQPLLYFGTIVTTTHDLTMLRFTRAGKLSGFVHAIRMQLYKFMFWASHRKSKAIIVPSEFVAKDLVALESFTKNKITVTYEASEPPMTSKAIRPKNINKPFILHVGSPFPHKNIDRLVEAFEIIHTTNPSLYLVLAGKKEYYFEQLEKKIASSPAKKQIIVTGFVSDGELKWLYQNAEAYALPSLSEGFGLPGLEAMAHSCPVVSSNATCLPEIYGHGAHYFNPEDVSDIASKIMEVVNSKTLQETLVKKGRARLNMYSWERMAEQTHKIYTSVA